jgi:ribonuclease-3
VADHLYHDVGDADEGQLSRMRAHLVKREMLARIARELKLGAILRLGAGELRSGGQARDSILADAVEAIIAAVYLDGGIDEARGLVRRLFGDHLADPTPDIRRKDPKTRLQEYLQSTGKPLPRYDVVGTSGDQHDQTFRVVCSTGLVEDTQGEGGSRRKAEQAAARAMLALLEETGR